jgi:hypothetical protein
MTMGRLRYLLSSVLLGLLAIGPALADEPRFATPEDAVTAYVEGVARQDYKAIYAATGIEEMTKGFDFAAYIDRLQVLTPPSPAPGTSPLFVEINRAWFTAQIMRQLQFLIYGLTTTSELVEGKTVRTDDAGAAFMAEADTTRLSGLSLLKIGAPSPALLNSELNVRNFTRQAAIYGAEESTERVALVAFEGRHYMIGFGLMRFGDEWRIERQVSYLAGTSAFGVPVPVTPESFDELLE